MLDGCMKIIQKPMYNYSGIVLLIQLDINEKYINEKVG